MLALVASALAVDFKTDGPYVQPHLGVHTVFASGDTHVQAALGAGAGQRWRDADGVHLLNHTRASVTGLYGITGGSLGADLRAGDFIGPDGRVGTLQVGPDLWVNGYGDATSEDYVLPWSTGLDLRTTVVGKLSQSTRLIGEAVPGWAFAASRQAVPKIWGLFDQGSVTGALALHFDDLRLTVGVGRVWDAGGQRDVLVIGGGL
jgi:hypothetical protein